MFLLILFTTFIFISASFLLEIPAKTTNPIAAYAITELSFIIGNFFVFTLGFIVAVIIYVIVVKFEHNIKTAHKIRLGILHFLQIAILSFFLSYISLFIIAIVQLNITSIMINISSKNFGVLIDTQEIIKKLKKASVAPKIIVNDINSDKTITSIAIANSGSKNFYGKFVLKSIPGFFIIPVKKTSSSLVLVDKTLIVSNTNIKDLEAVSPVVAHLFVKEYFGNKFVKYYPKITTMNNKQYQEYRKAENTKKIKKIDENLKDISSHISTISAAITNDKINIEQAKATGSAALSSSDEQYKRCIKYYEISECEKIKNQLSKKENKPENKAVTEWQKQLEFDESLLRAYTYYEKFYRAQRAILLKSRKALSDEHGVFEPEDLIKVRIEKVDPTSLSEYFSVLIHEYFHYASYNKDKKFANTFFEEGLTEYFARQVVEHNLEIKTNLGYPIQAKIISQISNRIAENELINIYFAKEDETFANALDRNYGEGFYEKNKINLQALQYTTTPQQLVQLANNIMSQIEGEKIVEKDYFSTETSLE